MTIDAIDSQLNRSFEIREAPESPRSAAEGFERRVLANGLEVLISRDASLPIVTSMLWYRVGSRCESLGGTGVSHFLEHMLFKGSPNFGKGEIDRLTLSCGGANNAFTWLDATTYYFSLPASHWELALRIESDRMQGALLEAAEIEAERQVILEEWQTAQDDPDEMFWDQLNAMALQRHPYRQPVLGWPEDIRGLTRESLLEHYRRYYHPRSATLVLVGDLPADAGEIVERHLGALPAGAPPAEPLRAEPRPLGEKRLWMPRGDVQLPRLSVCWPAPALADVDYAPLMMLHYLLSEGWSSRLYQALVETRHFASDVGSVMFETRDPYLFWIQVDLNDRHPSAEVEAALFAEITAIQAEGPLPQELARIRNQLLTDFYLNQETTEGRAEFAGEITAAGGWELFCDYQQRLEAVTGADIQRVAREWLRADRRCVGWIWPEHETSDDAEGEEDSDEEIEAPVRHVPGPSQGHHRPELTTAQPDGPSLPLPEVHLPRLDIYRATLANGLTTLIHSQPKVPTFSLVCWLPAGSHLDPADQRGLANLTLTSLVKGTRQRGARAFSEAIEALGADLSLSASLTGASLEIEALSRHLEPVLELLQETLRQPALAASEIAKEKKLILADLQMARESAGYLAGNALLASIYGASAAAFPVDGEAETVARLGPAEVEAFYRRCYGPKGGIIALSGDVDAALAADALERHFGSDWGAHLGAVPGVPALERQSHFSYRHIPLPGRDQCTLLLGHLGVPRNHPDFPALLLLDVMLGNGPGFAARIPRRLRDELGLAYYINHSATIGAQLWPGTVQAQIETSPERARACVAGILQEIRAVQQDGVTPAELDAAKAYLSGRFLFMFETNAQRAGYLLQQQIYGWPADFLNLYLETLRSVDLEQIQQVARRHLDTRHYTLISAGPRPQWQEDELEGL